jgi:general secretion pathway protein D
MKNLQTLVLLAVLAASPLILRAQQPGGAPPNPAAPTATSTNTLSVAPTNQAPAGPSSPAAVPAAVPAKELLPAAGGATRAVAQEIPQPIPPAPGATNAAPAGVSQTAQETAPAQAVEAPAPAVPAAARNGTNGLYLNFHGASLEQVLSHLSAAAGFIIVQEAQPKGRVDVFSDAPVTKEEAVNLLDQALKKNGYAAIRNGRTLTIVPRDEAKTRSIPVKFGAEPESIPINDEIVTQIIPVRFVEVAQLIKDLQPLVSTQTTMTANESGNEIVITDTQANIHKVAEIIKAIDAGAEDFTVVKVFHLNYADPTEMADLLVNLFPDDTRSGGSSSPTQFGGFGGLRSFFRGGGPGGSRNGSTPSPGNSGNQNARIKKRARVVAVPDPRTSSVAVSSARDLMDQIEGVVTQLDSDPAKRKTVKVYKIENADAQQVMQVVQDMFPNSAQNNQRTANQTSTLEQRSRNSSGQTTTSGRSSYGSQNSRGGGVGSMGP